MRILVTGAGGQLGYDIMRELSRRGHEVIGTEVSAKDASLVRMDITDRDQVMAVMSQTRPEAVIHCAAWTAVDLAEDPENREKVFAINAEGTRNVAEAAKAVGAVIMYISTDYIFDGRGTEPWKPDCKFNGIPAGALGDYVLKVLFGKQDLLQDALGLKLSPHSAGLDVGQNLLQVSDALGKGLHLPELLVHALKLIPYLLE